MENLSQALEKLLQKPSRIAILGIGSELRGDDIAGMLVAQELEKFSKESKPKIPFKVFLGGTAPENLTGEIKKYDPSHVIIIDTADMGEKPGFIGVLNPEDEKFCGSFSTHRMPCKVLIDYLKKSIGCKVIMIGIQAKCVDFGKEPSEEVKAAVKKLIYFFYGCFPAL